MGGGHGSPWPCPTPSPQVVSNIARPDELGLQGRDVPDFHTDRCCHHLVTLVDLLLILMEKLLASTAEGHPGISFAIPIDYAKGVLKKSAEATEEKEEALTIPGDTLATTMVTLNPQIEEELKD